MAKTNRPPVALTTPQLIDLAKRKLSEREPPERRDRPMSDYRLAQVLGVRQQTVSGWQHGKSHIGREFVIRFAEATGLPEVYVFACVELERERDPGVRGVLLAIAQGVSRIAARRAASLVLGVGLAGALAAPVPSQAAVAPSARAGVCILCSIGRGAGRRGRFDRTDRTARRRRRVADVIRATVPRSAVRLPRPSRQ